MIVEDKYEHDFEEIMRNKGFASMWGHGVTTAHIESWMNTVIKVSPYYKMNCK